MKPRNLRRRPSVTRYDSWPIALIFVAVAVAVGACGSSSSSSALRDSTGTIDDWVAAVCQPGSYESTGYNPMICNGNLAESGGFRSQIFVFEYASRDDMQANRKLWNGDFGYGTCVGARGRIAVFKPDVSGIGDRPAAVALAERSLQPLTDYGCGVSPPGSSNQPIPAAPTQPSSASARPIPSAPPVQGGAVELPANPYGYVSVETKSGRVRCMVETSRVVCETAEKNWPEHGVEIGADGSARFADGNLGDIQPTRMGYQIYRAVGWTVVASDAGTKFTNDRTGHGAVVSVERVQTF